MHTLDHAAFSFSYDHRDLCIQAQLINMTKLGLLCKCTREKICLRAVTYRDVSRMPATKSLAS